MEFDHSPHLTAAMDRRLADEMGQCLCCGHADQRAMVRLGSGESMMSFVSQARQDERAWASYVREPALWE